ncbi:MAG: hypothetical protein Q7P63_12535 [Verrucomicrobiota bacterium JB022]|nr:hypothetical protein [Verrucomicrobiota bacterium JB022]
MITSHPINRRLHHSGALFDGRIRHYNRGDFPGCGRLRLTGEVDMSPNPARLPRIFSGWMSLFRLR